MAHELTRPPRRATAQRDARMSLHMRSDTFERLFEEHAGRLFSFLVYRTGNRALAEDLLSETFERVLRSRQRFDPRRGSERRWLYTIALNLLRDQARRRTNEEQVLRHVSAGDTARALRRRAGRGRAPRRALPRAGDAQRGRARGARPALRRRPEAARRRAACSARARAPSRAGSTARSASCAASTAEQPIPAPAASSVARVQRHVGGASLAWPSTVSAGRIPTAFPRSTR